VTAKTIGYWTTTAVLAFVLLSGGAVDVVHWRPAVEGMVHLGYPPYVMTILGVWKLLGGGALLAPGLPRLKEWAYAGAFFDLTGAAASHAATGDDASHVLWPLAFAACVLCSRALLPESRTSGLVAGPRRADGYRPTAVPAR
jgi:DoxX-like protein